MKTVDLRKSHHDLADILTMAKSEDVLVRSESGDDFFIELAEDFEREAAALGESSSFMAFLDDRSSEAGDRSLGAVRGKRGL
jgi:hypothetical protein